MYICRRCGCAAVKPFESYDRATGRMERSCHQCESEDLLYLKAELYGEVADVLDSIQETLLQKGLSKKDAVRVIKLWTEK